MKRGVAITIKSSLRANAPAFSGNIFVVSKTFTYMFYRVGKGLALFYDKEIYFYTK
ncbi:hypothetical protein SAMN05444392_105122 [Seinonella peptonophila]|uniref:Uncharacterized protein n=1 Tax=Seinonella peptonophila TaxID=112248 RepID=A0A1M4XQ18_9BACL|nr:hypothetical protein SAMN05444392_105122 [Seinonella peptonophila]